MKFHDALSAMSRGEVTWIGCDAYRMNVNKLERTQCGNNEFVDVPSHDYLALLSKEFSAERTEPRLLTFVEAVTRLRAMGCGYHGTVQSPLMYRPGWGKRMRMRTICDSSYRGDPCSDIGDGSRLQLYFNRDNDTHNTAFHVMHVDGLWYWEDA